MTAKILTSVGCLLLLAAALTPAALGHSERGNLLVDASGYSQGAQPNNHPDGVSGRYAGGAGPAVADLSPGGFGTLASGTMLCDFEVVVDNPAFAGNEEEVDGSPAGSVPDTWDDGGVGGACHTVHYTTQQFNTPGCQAGQRAFGGSHAGTDIWIGAACDWKEDQGGVAGAVTLTLCLVNAALAFDPLGNLLVEIQAFLDCITSFVICLLDPACGAAGATQTCGADFKIDAISYGYGGRGIVGAPVPAYFPVSPNSVINGNPPVVITCNGREAASVFVFDAVVTDFVVIEIHPALTGEIWS